MPSISDTLNARLKVAMKNRDVRTVSLCRLAKDGLATKATELRSLSQPKVMTEDDELQVMRNMAKKASAAAEQFLAVSQEEKAAELQAEAAWYEQFLPVAPTQDEIRAVIDALVAQHSNIAPIMAGVKAKFGSNVDMKLASTLARDGLAQKTA